MAKQIPLERSIATLKLSVHDVLIFMQARNFYQKQVQKVWNYILLLNWYFVFVFLFQFAKQVVSTLWENFYKDALKWWSIIYLLLLIALGIVLPGSLTPVWPITQLKLWAAWIGLGCCTSIFCTPYSLILMLKIYFQKLEKQYHDQLQKINIQTSH